MSTLPRATGTPGPRAKFVIDQIYDYALRPPSDDVDENAERVRGLHHILDAAQDSLRMGLAVVNSPGWGRVSYREARDRLGIDKDTVQNYVRRGKELLQEMGDQ